MLRVALVCSLAVALAPLQCARDAEKPTSPAARPAAGAQWYRGNTHVHTVRCGHADTEPEAVARWYLDRGYHFLCLSEHNQFIDPATVKLPDPRRADFILVP